MIYPAVWLLLAVPLALKSAGGNEVPNLRRFVAAVFSFFFICLLTICLHLLAGERYELDFLSALLLLSVIGFLGVECRTAHFQKEMILRFFAPWQQRTQRPGGFRKQCPPPKRPWPWQRPNLTRN
jgi:hypothetical protein